MFVAEKDTIAFIDMSAGARLQQPLTWSTNVYINAVDGNSHTETLYYTDLSSRSIMSSAYDGTNHSVVSLFLWNRTTFMLCGFSYPPLL